MARTNGAGTEPPLWKVFRMNTTKRALEHEEPENNPILAEIHVGRITQERLGETEWQKVLRDLAD